MSHEADGIYYVDKYMLRKAYACETARRKASQDADEKGRTLLTEQFFFELGLLTGYCGWMRTNAKFDRFDNATLLAVFYPITETNEDQETAERKRATATMDALASRARREGLLK